MGEEERMGCGWGVGGGWERKSGWVIGGVLYIATAKVVRIFPSSPSP